MSELQLFLVLIHWIKITSSHMGRAVAVGRAVASDTVVQTPASPKINLVSNVIVCQLQPWKDENKEKEAGNGLFF